MDEAKLIEWPAPQTAALQTVQVVAIMAASTAMLFGINYVFNQAAQALFDRA